MKKHLEYFDGAFDSTVDGKRQPENKPYVAYSKESGVLYTIIPKEDIYEVTFLRQVTAEDLKDTEYQVVDLGLPSGTKWLDRNIGAKSVDDYGAYFTWGNTDGVMMDTVLMTLDEVTELLVGPNYTDDDKNQVKSDIELGLLDCTYKLADYPFGSLDAYNETFGSKLEVRYKSGYYTVTDHNDSDKVLANNVSYTTLRKLKIPLAYDIMNRINDSYVMPTTAQFKELVNETNVTNILHDDNGNEYIVTLYDNVENGADETDGKKDSYTVNPELPEGTSVTDLKLDRIVFTNKNDSSKSISFKANGYCSSFDSSTAIGIPEGNVYKPSTGSLLNYLDFSGHYWSSNFYTSLCYKFVFTPVLVLNYYNNRPYGCGVRGVQA